MLKRVAIRNFKSIEELELSPRRVNVFIGEAGSGKSNIVEALALLCPGTYSARQSLSALLRVGAMADLVLDRDTARSVEIIANDFRCRIKWHGADAVMECFEGNNPNPVIRAGIEVGRVTSWGGDQLARSILGYRYEAAASISFPQGGPLMDPLGENLTTVVAQSKELGNLVKGILEARGFRLVIDRESNALRYLRENNDELFIFPWFSLSETLRRIVFYLAAIMSNSGVTLLLDEPDAQTFPYFSKFLGERIALDQANQYFITTHNPYVLSALVEKTPELQLAVYRVSFENYRTHLAQLSNTDLVRLQEAGLDAFFNLDEVQAS